ncbi:hypothetical protein J3R30DRAFT_3278590 [Lentinula aciculospora]|uniref:Uncharacterized protein n=1 Tax=Lentinula aciculospora TaxID=153920 RepID=A0A9W9DXN2_9AGAR|nr:hypothetical protein J3R30DRAFT_3278590 [Lentinula aciculospora]
MSTGDPRVQQHRTRLPKSYTDQQLAFLKSHLPEFERRTQGSIRGDAKKFALEKAADFIDVFGLPNEFIHVEEAEPRFKEQIYNWFKNTVGRTRRKLEGRPRSMKKALEKGVAISTGALNNALDNNWSTGAPTVMPYAHTPVNSATASPTQTLVSPIQYSGIHRGSIDPMSVHRQSSHRQSPRQHHSSLELAVNLQITTSTLRNSFSQGIDASSLASMIHTFVMSNPSTTPLTPVITSLFEAITAELSFSRDPRACLRRFLDASTLFPPSIIHAGVSGPLAGPRALQMQIRKNSIWFSSRSAASVASSSSSYSISDEMQRLANDRQRKKDHIQWARIHAAALELGMLNMEHSGHADDSGYSYAMSRAFSEMTARDAVWEEDEVEWVAGIYVLRAVIRTAMQGDQRKRDEYRELLATYERRLKEIRDENRQTMVAEALMGAKEDIAQLDGVLHN